MGTEETGLPGGVPEASLLAALMLMIRLCFGKMNTLEKAQEGTKESVEKALKAVSEQAAVTKTVQSGLSRLQDRREDDTKALVSTLHEITLTLHKIGSQIEVQTKLTEKCIDQVDRRD